MIALMSVSGFVSNIITIVSGLLVAKWLLPEELGFFNGLSVVAVYVILIQMGIPNGLGRQYPYYLGRQEEDKAMLCAATANMWSFLTGVGCIIVALLIAAYMLLQNDYAMAVGVFVVGITSFQGLYVTKYLKMLYRSNNDFNKLSVIDIVNALVAFAGIFFVWKYKFYGLCMRSVLSFIVDLVLTYHWRPVKVKQQWNKPVFSELLKTGFPIFWVANVYSLWPMLQRTVIVSMGGAKALGLFSLAAIVESTMKTLTSAISNVSFPRMTFFWGKNGDFLEILKMPLKKVLASVVVNTLLCGAGWFLLPVLIKGFLPNYIDGTAAAQWMLWVGWIGSFSVFSNIYMVIQKNMDRLWSYVAGVVAWLICSLVLNKVIGFNLVIFPIATIVGFVFIYAVDIINFRRYYVYYSKNAAGSVDL